jgi:hypothetical protein
MGFFILSRLATYAKNKKASLRGKKDPKCNKDKY